ncbi:FecCD family ABC transporter permease [Pseudonocardia hispaniensis]|uniref:FecCD family ABC transporter permease n=1 Tax=Pseudonocardia hispaniensis TaxID=904933 RepID=A0ABW1J6K9_9PSEU
MSAGRCALLVLLVALAAAGQLLVGTSVGPAEAVAALLGRADPLTTSIVLDLRAPRVLIGLAAGACLGLAGAVLQAVLRNPLASPEVTGVGSGAVLGAVAASLVGGALAGPAGMVATAVLGGTLGAGVVWLVAARAGTDPLRLAVLGVLVSSVLAGTTLVLLTARPQLTGSMTRWLIGSLSGRGWEHWAALWPVLLGCLLGGFAFAVVLGLLAVDDDHARGVGLAVSPYRGAALLLAVLATAAAVASVGALVFVGLLAPHAARALVGADHRVLLPAAAVAGAATVAGADFVAQLITRTAAGEAGRIGVPAGAVTALAGAVVLIGIVRRRSRSVVGEES